MGPEKPGGGASASCRSRPAHAPGMDTSPVQSLEQGLELRPTEPHHAVLNARRAIAQGFAIFQFLEINRTIEQFGHHRAGIGLGLARRRRRRGSPHRQSLRRAVPTHVVHSRFEEVTVVIGAGHLQGSANRGSGHRLDARRCQ